MGALIPVAIISGLLVVGHPAAPALRSAPRVATDPPPNVLIILTDDQRNKAGYDYMPATLDRFRNEGTEFNQAFATTPLCCPSRATIFTGQYTHNHGVWGNDPGDIPHKIFRRAPDIVQETTMQYYLHGAGYRTAIFGKYLNKWNLDTPPPHFDEWAIFSNSGIAYKDGTWQVDGTKKKVAGYYAGYLGDRATQFIRDSAGTPWFMEVATAAPHPPYDPQQKYEGDPVGRFDGNAAVSETDKSDKPGYIKDAHEDLKDAQPVRDDQVRTLMSVDDMVERIFDALDETGQTESTLAFFLSDNGYMWAEHGYLGKRPPYTQSIRIPFFVRWPGHLARNDADARLVGPVDIAPTVFEATGITPTHVLDGHSLLSTYKRSRILLEFAAESGVPTWAATYTKHYEFIQDYNDAGKVSFKEYYDLDDDPWELTNLLHDNDPGNNPDLDPLKATLNADRICAGAGCP